MTTFTVSLTWFLQHPASGTSYLGILAWLGLHASVYGLRTSDLGGVNLTSRGTSLCFDLFALAVGRANPLFHCLPHGWCFCGGCTPEQYEGCHFSRHAGLLRNRPHKPRQQPLVGSLHAASYHTCSGPGILVSGSGGLCFRSQ